VHGVGAAKLVTGAGANPKIESGGSGLIAVTPGATVLVGAWLRADTARALTLDLNWFNASSALFNGDYAGPAQARVTYQKREEKPASTSGYWKPAEGGIRP
jgi:hypothetical protein